LGEKALPTGYISKSGPLYIILTCPRKKIAAPAMGSFYNYDQSQLTKKPNSTSPTIEFFRINIFINFNPRCKVTLNGIEEV